MTENSEFHEASHSDGGPALYAKWAPDYEEYSHGVGYVAYKSVVSVWQSYYSDCSSKYKVLDAGCGTGLVGEALKMANTNLEVYGADLSPDMLELARQKNVYNDLKVVDLKDQLPYTQELFDSIVSAGVFLHGHCGPECLSNVMAVLKKKGHFITTVRVLFYEETKDEWTRQVEKCGCRIVECRDEPYYNDSSDLELSCPVLVIQKS